MSRAAGADATAVEILAGSAEALPLPDTRVDVAVATQVFEYVADLPGAVGARNCAHNP